MQLACRDTGMPPAVLRPAGRAAVASGRGRCGTGGLRGRHGGGPRDRDGEAGPGERYRARRADWLAAGSVPGRVRRICRAVLADAEIADDAPGLVHPAGRMRGHVIHDPVGEVRGGLVQAPRCPPDPGVAVPSAFQPVRQDVCGPGDRQADPGGQGAGEAADADVLTDLRPVVTGCFADGADQLPGGAADPGDALPFRRVAVPAGTGLGLGGSLVQRAACGRVRSCAAAGVPTLRGQVQDVPEVGESRADVIEAAVLGDVAVAGGGPVTGRTACWERVRPGTGRARRGAGRSRCLGWAGRGRCAGG